MLSGKIVKYTKPGPPALVQTSCLISRKWSLIKTVLNPVKKSQHFFCSRNIEAVVITVVLAQVQCNLFSDDVIIILLPVFLLVTWSRYK